MLPLMTGNYVFEINQNNFANSNDMFCPIKMYKLVNNTNGE
jgi:hypothetical protein